MDAREVTALVDVQSDLGSELGELIPWLEPAIRLLSADRFDVAAREEALVAAGRYFIDCYASGYTMRDMSLAELEYASSDLLGKWVVAKARELQIRAMRDRV